MKKLLALLILSTILVSCGTTNKVVNDGLFQKRKHTSGWFVKKNKKYKEKSSQNENIALEEGKQKVDSSLEKKEIKQKGRSAETHIQVAEKLNMTDRKYQEDKKPQHIENKPGSEKQYKNRVATKETHLIQSSQAMDDFGAQKKSRKTKVRTSSNSSSRGGLELILLILLAIIIPPLAVFIVQGGSKIFLIDLILFIIGWSTVWFFNLSGIASLAAIVIALLVLFGIL